MTTYADDSWAADAGPLLRARSQLLNGMPAFLALVEVDATARRAVIAYDEPSGVEPWDTMYAIARDACLVIESRIAAEEAVHWLRAEAKLADQQMDDILARDAESGLSGMRIIIRGLDN